MKKLLLLLSLLLVPVLALADGEGNTIMLKFAGVPTGNCSFIMMGLNTANGNLYSCPAGAWVLSGAGSGGGLPAHLSYADPTLTVSAATFGNGQVALSGNTSGTATITAPAVAGTATNPIVFSNAISVPAGAAATPAVAFPNGVGMSITGGVSFAANGAIKFTGGGGNFSWELGTDPSAHPLFASQNNGGLGWASGGDPNGNNIDTYLSQPASTLLSVGASATQGSESGYIRWNTCKLTTDTTLPVNTATTLCNFTLPASARSWAWQCDLVWAITAGTGTNTISIGVNPSQTPTGTTNAAAVIYSAASTFVTGAAVAIGASGAINVLTSGTITPGASAWTSHTAGTLLASGTAGSFLITMTAAGTTATAAAKAGSTCVIY